MRLVAVLCACALGLSLASCGSGGGSASAHSSGSGATHQALAQGAAHAFLSTYTTDGGRIQRTDQGGDTVGEGQAYGMLLAAAIGDQKRFDRIWSWTKSNMRQHDGLLAFHWVGGHVVDPQPAADADLDAARALLVASCRFGRPDLRDAALSIGRAVLAHETAKAASLHVLIAGPWAKKSGALVFNPSYVDPTTLDALAKAGGDHRFRTVSVDSVKLVNELTRPLPPDWATVSTKTGQVTPVSGPSSTAGPGMFTYDAPRTLVRLGVAADPTARSAVARAWDVFKQTRAQDIVTEHQLSGAAVGTDHNPVTLVAVAAAADAAGDRRVVPGLLQQAQKLNNEHPTYYGAAWLALGRLLLTTNLLDPCTS